MMENTKNSTKVGQKEAGGPVAVEGTSSTMVHVKTGNFIKSYWQRSNLAPDWMLEAWAAAS